MIARCLENDSATYVDDAADWVPTACSVSRCIGAPVTRTTTFAVVSGPGAEWYVEQINLRDVHSCTVQAGQPVSK